MLCGDGSCYLRSYYVQGSDDDKDDVCGFLIKMGRLVVVCVWLEEVMIEGTLENRT